MKTYFRRMFDQLGDHDVFTYTLPYEARFVARTAAQTD
jgi:hypothetical protein